MVLSAAGINNFRISTGPVRIGKTGNSSISPDGENGHVTDRLPSEATYGTFWRGLE